MSEHQDPIRRLETFDSGGGTMTPMAPSEVRRLGNRRRTRRRAAYTVAAAVAVAIAIIPVALLHGDDAAPPITHHSGGPTPPSTSPSPSATATPPQVITYPGIGVNVVTTADTAKLTGTSDDFRTFIGGLAQKAAADGASCPGAAHGVTVQKYSTAGYAIGGFNACGGYAALWTRYHDTWGEGQATQDAWDCDALAYLDVPTSFTGPCFDESGTFGMPGAGGPEPGMTKAEAEAAGIIVTSDATAPPCSSTQYAAPVVPGDDTRGLFSPRDGLVQVAMTSTMKTEEKVGLGSLRSKVLTAYPNRKSSGDVWIVPRPNGTDYLVRFGPDHRVVAFTWQLDRADCADYML